MSSSKIQLCPELSANRNIGIIAHIDAGKTTVTERFLYISGKTHRIGEVDCGNTVMDYLDEERKRGITIVAAVAEFAWSINNSNFRIHLIDTPGHIDFTAEVERSLRIIDGAIVIMSGVEGVEAQTEKVWRQSDNYKTPKIVFINKLDRLGADFQKSLHDLQCKFSDTKIAAIQIPIGLESNLKGFIDLIKMKAYHFDGSPEELFTESKIHHELLKEAEEARAQLMSTLADISDNIAELFIEEKPIPKELIYKEIRKLTITNDFVPVLLGSAKKNIGITALLDAVINFLPSPEDKKLFNAHSIKDDSIKSLDIHDEKFYGLIFKIIAGENTDLHYLRIYSGTLSLNDVVFNPRTKEKIKIKRILRLHSKTITPVETAFAGHIIGLTGVNGAISGDTLCNINNPLILEKITFPEPIISMAVEAKNSKDKKRLEHVLEMLCREDPTLRIENNESTGQRIISGMGELHLEIKAHRIKEDFKLDVIFGKQQVAYRETLKNPIEAIIGEFKKIIGEQELTAKVQILFTPLSDSTNCIKVSSKKLKNKANIPSDWIKAAEEALINGLKTGGNWGYSLININAEILSIEGEQDKTTENAVAGAVFNALNKAIANGTSLLEPLVKLQILSPEECVGEISSYIQMKRALIHNIETIGKSKQMICEVPLSEMFGFSKALPKLSGGRASFSMEPCGYNVISIKELEKLAKR
jgi:elongation factor G